MSFWGKCLQSLEQELSDQQLNTWIRPLQVVEDSDVLRLLAPNRFVLDWVEQHFMAQIREIADRLAGDKPIKLLLEIGSQAKKTVLRTAAPNPEIVRTPTPTLDFKFAATKSSTQPVDHNLNSGFTFDNFVAGKSNELARAASLQVAENPGGSYNPLFLYGGVGLGKTHLMHAVGNRMREIRSDARIVYLHSERFVGQMIKALQHNAIDEFKQFYRSLDALLIDDIQFFAGKERSQEE